jgi:flavin-dependent dehydrogenase
MNHEKILTASWLIDCSGRSRLLNQELKWQFENTKHQTGSVWAHFENLKPMSSWDLKKSKVLDFDTISPRYNVTGHFMRHGLWWWHIPLNDHTVSLGVVYDKNIHTESNPRVLFEQLTQKMV